MSAAGYVIGLLVSLPVATAAVKVVLFVGKATSTLEQTARAMEKVVATQGEHGERIAAVEARIDAIEPQHQQPAPRPFPNYRPEPSR